MNNQYFEQIILLYFSERRITSESMEKAMKYIYDTQGEYDIYDVERYIEFLIRENDIGKAEVILNRINSKYRKNFRYVILTAIVQMKKDDLEGAFKTLSLSIRDFNTDMFMFELYFVLCVILDRQGEYIKNYHNQLNTYDRIFKIRKNIHSSLPIYNYDIKKAIKKIGKIKNKRKRRFLLYVVARLYENYFEPSPSVDLALRKASNDKMTILKLMKLGVKIKFTFFAVIFILGLIYSGVTGSIKLVKGDYKVDMEHYNEVLKKVDFISVNTKNSSTTNILDRDLKREETSYLSSLLDDSFNTIERGNALVAVDRIYSSSKQCQWFSNSIGDVEIITLIGASYDQIDEVISFEITDEDMIGNLNDNDNYYMNLYGVEEYSYQDYVSYEIIDYIVSDFTDDLIRNANIVKFSDGFGFHFYLKNSVDNEIQIKINGITLTNDDDVFDYKITDNLLVLDSNSIYEYTVFIPKDNLKGYFIMKKNIEFELQYSIVD